MKKRTLHCFAVLVAMLICGSTLHAAIWRPEPVIIIVD